MSCLSDLISKRSAKAVCTLLHNIYKASQLIFQPQRQLHWRAIELELISHLIENPDGVRARPVTLVDEGQAGHVVAPHLPVHSDGLTLQPQSKLMPQAQQAQAMQLARSLHCYDGCTA